jgi:hypothetical protein
MREPERYHFDKRSDYITALNEYKQYRKKIQ